ncbi:MAG: regulator of sigma protease [Candidatus Parcubacteria bacterium]|jgi:regulator of sigma E protease|nr:regulator of sigma protease [Candidatus Parcubacteria bacterium]
MTVILFIVILVVLIVVHEFGHFLVAKWSGMRVDEFGVGYPPRVWGRKYGETEYTLNALPFGGFVKIYGEDDTDAASARAFSARPRILQALTLIAGVAMNLLLAYVIITIMLGVGTPRALTSEEALIAPDASLVIAGVLPGSPAERAGLEAGDRVVSIANADGEFSTVDPNAFTAYVSGQAAGNPLTFDIVRGEQALELSVAPETGAIPGEPERAALGVSLATVGTVAVPWYQAPVDGAILTWEITKETAIGLAKFFGSVFTLSANLAQVSGPVGIAGAVGDAYSQGLASLFTITALISINLALINLLPIPALDGGRLLFVIIESIIRRPIPTAFVGAVNMAGFAFLILLMVVVTGSDIFKLVT